MVDAREVTRGLPLHLHQTMSGYVRQTRARGVVEDASYRTGAVTVDFDAAVPIPPAAVSPFGDFAEGFVALFPVDAGTVGMLRAQARSLAAGQSDQVDSRACCRALRDAAPASVAFSEDCTHIGFARNPPGLPTVSRTGRGSGDFLGLHLDDWSGVAADGRAHTLSRISVNLGTEERHLLICRQPFTRMYAWHVAAGGAPDLRPYSRIGAAFLSAHPETEILILGVPPGWAYLAPTENALHDASTLEMGSEDLTYVIQGRFTAGAWADPQPSDTR